MNIGFMQFDPVRHNVKRNIDSIAENLSKIQFDLMVLPELANSGYLYDSREELHSYSESRDCKGEFLKGLQEICREKNACIVSGFSEKDGLELFNSSAAITKDGVTSLYRKTHLFNTENSLFNPGNTGFRIFNFNGVIIGMMICFDWIFPESARSLALQGCQVIAHPANLVLTYCQSAMLTRSIENGVFTITANRVGTESLENRHLTFTGKSQITNPNGEVLVSADDRNEQIMLVEIDPKEALNKQISERNDLLLDRRPEFYRIK